MANPNIINVANIQPTTVVANVSTTSANLVTNSSGSNKVFKINSLIIANKNTASANVTVNLNRSSVDYALAFTVAVPSQASIVVVSKDSSVYVQEGDVINVLASANSYLQAVCSYDDIS